MYSCTTISKNQKITKINAICISLTFNLCVHMEQVFFCGLNFNSFGVFSGPASILEHHKNIKLWQNACLYKIYWEILFQKVALGYLLHIVQNGSSNNILNKYCLHNNLKHLETARPGFHLGAPKKHKVMTKSILCKIYRQLLFQKVASGYLIHFAHNGSSNKYKNKN